VITTTVKGSSLMSDEEYDVIAAEKLAQQQLGDE